MFINEATHEFI